MLQPFRTQFLRLRTIHHRQAGVQIWKELVRCIIAVFSPLKLSNKASCGFSVPCVCIRRFTLIFLKVLLEAPILASALTPVHRVAFGGWCTHRLHDLCGVRCWRRQHWPDPWPPGVSSLLRSSGPCFPSSQRVSFPPSHRFCHHPSARPAAYS